MIYIYEQFMYISVFMLALLRALTDANETLILPIDCKDLNYICLDIHFSQVHLKVKVTYIYMCH